MTEPHRRTTASTLAAACTRASVVGIGLVVVVVGLLAGCSDGSGASANGADVLDPSTLVLLTDTRGEEARAGLPFKVDCRAFRRVVGATSADAIGDEVALPSMATLTWASGAAAPQAISGSAITLGLPGIHHVRCATVGGELSDEVGADLPVVAGPPVALQTELFDADGGNLDAQSGGAALKAGGALRVRCSGSDALGNAISSGWKLKTEPAIEGALPLADGFALTPKKAGTYAVACMVEGSADTTPAELVVVANVPKHLFTLLDPPEIEAGNATKLACVTTDAHGNAVADFPIAVDHSDKLMLKGLYLSATEAGVHSVRCVPETLAWDPFTLHGATLKVVPASAYQLLVARVPDKGVYKRKEKIKFAPTVRDIYGNIRLHDKVGYEVTSPAKGYKDKGDFVVQFNTDNTYELRFWVLDASAVEATLKVIVDGAPPLLTIDYPPWGSTLDGKPSVTVEGKAGDEGSGIKSLLVNGKAGYPDAIGEWKVGQPANHGLTMIQAVATDMGDEISKAVRGFYYSGKYYPTDAGNLKGAMVPKGMQVFIGKDFFDDGVHDKSHPDDLATLIEVVGSAALGSQLLPSNLSSGDVTVTLSNTKIGPLAVKLTPKTGGLHMVFEVVDISTDLKVKAKIKLGPIKTSVSVSGDIKIAKVRVAAFLKMEVQNGFPVTEAHDVDVQIDGMKLHVDGIAGLFDFVYNLILNDSKKQIEQQLKDTLKAELPKALKPIFDQLSISQSFEVPPSLGTGKTATVTFVTEVKTMVFSELGAVMEIDASFASQKGVPHPVKGSIGRDGCVGTSPDQFTIDTTQRLQFAMHDDLINQLLYAIWYGGAMQLSIPLADLAGQSDFSGFSLEGATMDLDFLLPPILEACNMPDPMAMRLQVGDLFATMKLAIGDDGLKLYNVVLADAGVTIGLGKDAQGAKVLQLTLAPELNLVVHLMDISKGWEDSKGAFADLIGKMIDKAMTDGSLPFGKPIDTPLPDTEIDLSATMPGVPAGTKMTIGLSKLERAGGYTSIVAEVK